MGRSTDPATEAPDLIVGSPERPASSCKRATRQRDGRRGVVEQTAYSPERPPPSLAHASGRCAHAGAPPRPGVRSPRSHAHRCGLPAPRATLVDGAHAWGRAGLAPRRRGGHPHRRAVGGHSAHAAVPGPHAGRPRRGPPSPVGCLALAAAAAAEKREREERRMWTRERERVQAGIYLAREEPAGPQISN